MYKTLQRSIDLAVSLQEVALLYLHFYLFEPKCFITLLYNNQINARTLIGQSAVGYCAGKPITCDQASLYFRGGKVRLIQLLDYLSVASPESGLFSDWSRNKRYLELSH